MTSKISKMQKKLSESIKACLNNAESFLKNAQSLTKNGSYGHSLSLAILGSEEIAKAFYLRQVYVGKIKIANLRKAIYYHREKQRSLLLLRALLDAIKSSIEEKIAEGKIVLNDEGKIVNQKLSDEDMLSLERKAEKEIEKIDFDSYREQKRLEKKKQKGFYVDVNSDGSVISSPSQVSQKEVEDAVADLNILLMFYRVILRNIT